MSIIFKIAIADGSGIKAGTMYISGNIGLKEAESQEGEPSVCNLALPLGTYSIQWNEATCYWESNYKEVTKGGLPRSTDAPASFTYTGGLLDGPEGKPRFEFPLAGDSSPKPPIDLADTLVVEVPSLWHVKFLDKSGATIYPKAVGSMPRPGNLANQVSHSAAQHR